MPGFTPAPAAAAKDTKVTASDVLLEESTGEESNSTTSYVSKKKIGVPSNSIRNTFRITMRLHGTPISGVAKGQLYLNGATLGTEQSESDVNYHTHTQDLEINAPGGIIELKIKTTSAGDAAYTDSLAIRGAETEHDQEYEVIT